MHHPKDSKTGIFRPTEPIGYPEHAFVGIGEHQEPTQIEGMPDLSIGPKREQAAVRVNANWIREPCGGRTPKGRLSTMPHSPRPIRPEGHHARLDCHAERPLSRGSQCEPFLREACTQETIIDVVVIHDPTRVQLNGDPPLTGKPQERRGQRRRMDRPVDARGGVAHPNHRHAVLDHTAHHPRNIVGASHKGLIRKTDDFPRAFVETPQVGDWCARSLHQNRIVHTVEQPKDPLPLKQTGGATQEVMDDLDLSRRRRPSHYAPHLTREGIGRITPLQARIRIPDDHPDETPSTRDIHQRPVSDNGIDAHIFLMQSAELSGAPRNGCHLVDLIEHERVAGMLQWDATPLLDRPDQREPFRSRFTSPSKRLVHLGAPARVGHVVDVGRWIQLGMVVAHPPQLLVCGMTQFVHSGVLSRSRGEENRILRPLVQAHNLTLSKHRTHLQLGNTHRVPAGPALEESDGPRKLVEVRRSGHALWVRDRHLRKTRTATAHGEPTHQPENHCVKCTQDEPPAST